MIRCPDPRAWLRFLDDDLPAPDRTALEGHLGACAACPAVVAGLVDDPALARLMAGGRDARPGPATMAMLRKLAATTEAAAARPDPPESEPTAPEIPGLAGWSPIGGGTMGVVFRATDVALGRPVAVKVLSAWARLSPSGRARAAREATVMASLRHPNVVQVHRSGEVDGLPFLVMEWVEGGTLRDRIHERPMDFGEAAGVVRDLSAAVAEAHALGIVHRDLKPANVLLAPSKGPGPGYLAKLTDFGLARSDRAGELTETGIALGTPGYMAPEQTGMDPAGAEVGPAADIHGLGAILYACLAGRSPYAAATAWDSLVLTAGGRPRPLREARRDVPLDLATIIEKCLRAAPSGRYRSAGELADDLGRFLESRPIAARPISPPRRWAMWARRRPALAATAALLAAATIGGAAGAAYHVATITRSLRDLAAEQARTRDALASASGARDQAGRARDQARRALASLTDDVVGRLMQRGAALDEADRGFLRKLRDEYLAWPPEPDPAAARRFQADGLERVGEIFRKIEQLEESRACLAAAVEVREEAYRRGEEGPGDIQPRIRGLRAFIDVLGGLERSVEAEAVARRMIATLAPAAGGDLAAGRDLARALGSLGNNLGGQLRPDDAEAEFRVAIALLDRLRIEHPADIETMRAELTAYYNAGAAALHNGLKDRAEGHSRSMIALAESSAVRFPQSSIPERYLAIGLGTLAGLVMSDRAEEALGLNRRRIEISGRLAALHPGDPNHPSDLIWACARSYQIHKILGRPGDAEPDLARGVAEATRMLAAEPAVFDRARTLVGVLKAQAELLGSAGRPREAIARLDQIAGAYGRWADVPGRTEEVIEGIRWAHEAASGHLAKLGDHAGAAGRLRLALAIAGGWQRPRLLLRLAAERLAAMLEGLLAAPRVEHDLSRPPRPGDARPACGSRTASPHPGERRP